MLGKKKLRTDLPPLDIRKKAVKGMFGRTKFVKRSKGEQRKVKAKLRKQYPDRYFVDDLHEWNSVKEDDGCDIEAFVAFWDD